MSNNQDHSFMEIERDLKEIDWSGLMADRGYYHSPASWSDEVLYFLFVDRFSDKQEYGGFADLGGTPVSGPATERSTPPFNMDQDAWKADREEWFKAGKSWCGGNLAGLKDKVGYLERLGVTALWLSPVFKQVTDSKDYHGYGIQNFLAVDPHFGTREDLKDFVSSAHKAGLRVILDIILNHAGDVFAYDGNHRYYYYKGRKWPVQGFRERDGDPGSLEFGPVDDDDPAGIWPDGAVWPRELQLRETWTCQGEIRDWNTFPEYIDGDFLSLKDIDHGPAPKDPAEDWDILRRIRDFSPSPALKYLSEVYKFWIAYADIDGYRIDTVKHMEPGAIRFFANVIHEFAQSLGKENFYLIGEVTGGRQHAVNIVNTTGIDAALGINEIPDKLEFLAKGQRSPGDPRSEAQEGYFDLFRNSLLDNKNSHQWFSNHIVTMFDDHDQVGIKHKFRFCGKGSQSYRLLPVAIALNLTTSGIPCIYYGTEQAFSGADHRTDDDSYSDAVLRECMFGGRFGSFQSTAKHFFNENHEIYQFTREVCALRKQHIALRRGRQYLREISGTGNDGDFHYPQPIGGELHWIIGWSRIFADQEYLCAVNTDVVNSLTVWATIDYNLNPPGNQIKCLLSTDQAQKGSTVTSEARNGSAIRITVPSGGFVIYH